MFTLLNTLLFRALPILSIITLRRIKIPAARDLHESNRGLQS
jgi:hypothetical protein